MKIERWDMPMKTATEMEAHYRSKIAARVAGLGAWDIVEKVTFDHAAPDLTVGKVEALLAYVQDKILKRDFAGEGFEVGAGCGFFCALLARQPKVTRIHAVEACEPIVRELMPKIVAHFAPDNQEKVLGCIGDFNRLQFADRSMDFAFDFYSLHHSDDLRETLKEIRRTLKPGGYLLCLDKARADSLEPGDLEKLLDTEYSEKAKANMGVDPSIRLTRRMNGEHEFRLQDWREAFLAAGFSRVDHYHLAKTYGGNGLISMAKSVISRLPLRLQTVVTSLLGRQGNANHLETSHCLITARVNEFAKEVSVLIAWA